MLKITNISGETLNISGYTIKNLKTVIIDVPYDRVRTLDKNGLISVQKVVFQENIIETAFDIDSLQNIEDITTKKSRKRRSRK